MIRGQAIENRYELHPYSFNSLISSFHKWYESHATSPLNSLPLKNSSHTPTPFPSASCPPSIWYEAEEQA